MSGKTKWDVLDGVVRRLFKVSASRRKPRGRGAGGEPCSHNPAVSLAASLLLVFMLLGLVPWSSRAWEEDGM